ncbi:MAG: hypothetical protein WHU54_03470 [Candidatus Bathyarchaeia archaeon]|jgi:hypothetical protein
MHNDLCRTLTQDFLKTCWPCLKILVEKLNSLRNEKAAKTVSLFKFRNGQKISASFDGSYFFLRGSVEYSNPQLTLEEVQGIIGARMLETCGNHFAKYGLHTPTAADINQICEALKKPSEGPIIAFLLNTDEIEADRYSMNPLRASIVESGQSAFPVAYVKTDQLKIDKEFVRKYEGALISRQEVELIGRQLDCAAGSYMDFVDSVKYAQMEELSQTFGMDLSLYTLRMPLTTLQAEAKDSLLHYVISSVHRDYESVSQAYSCMGRSMASRTTLLTVPHSKLGYGSKRAARGKIHFEGTKLDNVSVTYQTTMLYPNEIDPNDVSIAKAEDRFTVKGDQLKDYSFTETPSSPQFFLYALASPERAALWHGVGAFAATKLLQSYTALRTAIRAGQFLGDLPERYSVKIEVPLQFNLKPESMWRHPVHGNIDASIGCVANPVEMVQRGMKLEYLSAFG